MKKYYKILNKNEYHHGLQYKTGLNIDPVSFNPTGFCEPGGIYYAQKDILAFLGYGPWIREVKIPEDAEVYKDPQTEPEKWKADRVILGRKYRITAKVIQKLINEGADIHAGNNSALRFASKNGNLEIVKLLFENGADIHADNDCALYYASANRHLETVKLLLENGADVNAQNDSALRCASEFGYFEVVELLLENGADVHAWDDFAIRLASKNGHLETVKLLLENGADIHTVNDYAIRFASESGHSEVVELLENWKSK